MIHLGELLPDGRPRFRQLLLIVARQNGKTHLCKVLALYWLFVERQPMIFGTSTNLEQAKESWEAAVESAQLTPALAQLIPRRGVKIGNGQQVLSTTDRCRYKIGAADRKGGRGKTIRRAIGDELREQHTWEAYNAVTFATNAVRDAQLVYISNMGDKRSVVLNALRDAALAGTDDRLGILEWSAPKGSHPADRAAWAAANPQLGRRMDPDALAGIAARVSKPGADPEELNGFLTEALCIAVDRLDPAIDPIAWARNAVPAPFDLTDRASIAACIDVAPSLQHATLAAGQLVAGDRVRVETIMEWTGPDTMARLRAELPGWVATVRPRALGWFPSGPGATLDAELRDRSKAGRREWPPRGVTVAEITNDAPAVMMAFSALVDADGVLHSGQEMLTAQVEGAEKLPVGDRWTVTRRGGGNVDAVYAAAGAAHLARTLPTRRKATRMRTAPA